VAGLGAQLHRLTNRLAPVADHTGRWIPPQNISVSFFPKFEDETVAGDALWKAAWALAPLRARIARVGAPGLQDPASLLSRRPDYLSRELDALALNLAPLLGPVSEAEALKADLILVWRFDAALDRRLLAKRVALVDDAVFEHAADRWARISSEAAPSPIAASLERIAQFDQQTRAHRAVVVGTGPSLDSGLEKGLVRENDDVYLCNSAVRRPDLFRRYRVRAIGLGDPVFHSGPCRMAGLLRADLKARMQEAPDVVLACPERDAQLYAAMPGFPADRMMALAIDDRLSIRDADLRRDAASPPSANVMTLTLLPLVTGRYAEIAFIGCDGKAPTARDYFWRHSPTAQYADDFDSAYLAHPAFFRRDFEAYSVGHAETLAEWIGRAEREGVKVTSLTPSHILPLSERFVS
jgi:hypothetical protein